MDSGRISVVAALAVFVGPIVTLKIAREERRTSLVVANKQIVAPMRQVWINNLRDKVADVLSTASWYYMSGRDPEHLEDDMEEAGDRVEKRLRFRVQEVELMLNLPEEDHRLLHEKLNAVVECCFAGSENYAEFPHRIREASQVCQRVLKREWNRVRAKIDPSQEGASAIPAEPYMKGAVHRQLTSYEHTHGDGSNIANNLTRATGLKSASSG
jgi:hypothetical protein